jgi:hypothetical protein
MYCLSDQQIDYILNDIGARGVEMESLQHNLLDHVCCIIEQNLEANGDFESFYQKSIKTFYKDELWEIEEETLQLLIFKNYYTMKKVMIISGLFSAAAMSLGIIFKFMHWPGASAFIILGIIASSLIFLPLLFILKSKEQETTKDKLVIGLGILSGISMSLSILFRVMHWPFGFNLAIFSITILGLLFLPIYFFNGIRNPEKKINTIAFSIVIIMICGLWLTLVVSPQGVRENNIRNTTNFLTNERILNNEKKLFEKMTNKDSINGSVSEISSKIISQCDELKSIIIEFETGTKTIDANFETNNQFIKASNISSETYQLHENKIMELTENVKHYNTNAKDDMFKIPTKNNIIEYFPNMVYSSFNTLEVLNQLTQIQLIVLQNERVLIAK